MRQRTLILLVMESANGLMFAHPVTLQGAAEVINMILHDKGLTGHRELIFKTDQIPATNLLQAVVVARRPEIMLENPP